MIGTPVQAAKLVTNILKEKKENLSADRANFLFGIPHPSISVWA
jgi:hypothetical protein